MTLLTETRERFLLTIVAQVPAERIVEIHFFQPIKQGGMESGVAVVAAWPEVPASESVDAPASIEVVESAEVAETAGDVADVVAATAVGSTADAPTIEQSREVNEHPAESFAEDGAVSIDESAIEDGDASDDAMPESDASSGAVAAAKARHTIYTARYRLTLKGPDRGKWESNVVAEADAPLVTVDAVVRGVQRRSGDVDEATRLDGDEVRALVHAKQAATPGAA